MFVFLCYLYHNILTKRC